MIKSKNLDQIRIPSRKTAYFDSRNKYSAISNDQYLRTILNIKPEIEFKK